MKINVSNVTKSYKHKAALKNISFTMEGPKIIGLLGHNGAGKTTLFNCIYGTLPLSSGKVYLAGKRIDHIPSFKRTEKGMGRTFQKNNLFEELTVEENVRLAIMGKKKYRLNMFKPMQNYNDLAEECHRLLEEWEMTERRTVLVKELSYGEQRLLEIILSLSTNPEIILLDEPTSGMSPTETSRFVKLIKKIPDHITLVIIEHDMEVVFSLANKITVLHHGTAMMTASPEEIRGNQMIQEIYFGGGALSHD